MATERIRIRMAPDGLALAQEVLNTRAIGPKIQDLLASEAVGLDWLRATVREWAEREGASAPAGELGAADLPVVRDLRTRLEGILLSRDRPGNDDAPAPSGEPARVPAELLVGRDGEVRLAPARALSWGKWLESAVWAEVLLAQHAGTWARLKLCREPACASAFYDMSRNNSGVWHDVRVCGNAANLRASRLRRKQQAGSAGQSHG
ncbi:MAG TPA: CGNR zinc finger domain-containing protein [Trebonia sp.]